MLPLPTAAARSEARATRPGARAGARASCSALWPVLAPACPRARHRAARRDVPCRAAAEVPTADRKPRARALGATAPPLGVSLGLHMLSFSPGAACAWVASDRALCTAGFVDHPLPLTRTAASIARSGVCMPTRDGVAAGLDRGSCDATTAAALVRRASQTDVLFSLPHRSYAYVPLPPDVVRTTNKIPSICIRRPRSTGRHVRPIN